MRTTFRYLRRVQIQEYEPVEFEAIIEFDSDEMNVNEAYKNISDFVNAKIEREYKTLQGWRNK